MRRGTLPQVAAVSSVIGAIAKMLTDADVDGVSATLYEREIARGRIFLSVNSDGLDIALDKIERILAAAGGKTSSAD